MARRLGRRKEPSREKYILKEEQSRVATGVFDERTMVYLSKFFNKGVIEKLGHVIARGKEADLYIADPGAAESVKGMPQIVIKFFRVESPSFFRMQDYIIGDKRFAKKATRKGKLGIITEWCKKEYINLEVAARAGINAPKPIMFNGNIIAMSFIGSDSIPAPRLRDSDLENPNKVLDKILKDTRALYRQGLVHADLSEYNILMLGEDPYIIDFGQAVVNDHPRAMDFLKRDVSNMLSYFEKNYGIKKELKSTLEWIIS